MFCPWAVLFEYCINVKRTKLESFRSLKNIVFEAAANCMGPSVFPLYNLRVFVVKRASRF